MSRPPHDGPLERDLEEHFRLSVKRAGGLAYKITPVTAGLPDRLVVRPDGRLVLVELKKTGGVLRPVQRVLHDKLARKGCHVVVLTGRNEITAWATTLNDNL